MARRAKAFQERGLSGIDYVNLWVDGIHLEVRLERQMIGRHDDGRNELVALADGRHQCTES